MAYYDEISEGYNDLHREEQEKKIEIILDLLEITNEDNILDVGCGTGFFLEKIHRLPHDPDLLTGIDSSQGMLKQCRDKEIRLIYGEAEHLPFKDKKFDIITSITAIHNFQSTQKGLEEINRVSKDDARIIITTLKQSKVIDVLKHQLGQLFNIERILEEDKDLIFVLTKKDIYS